MAALQERSGSYRVLFRYLGKQHTFTLGEVSRDEAEAKAAQVDYLLMRLKQRLVALPEGTDIVSFVQYDGKPPVTNGNGHAPAATPRKAVPLSQLKERHLDTHGNGTIEANSLDTCRLHLGHFCRVLGDGFPLPELTHAKLQEYVNKRAAAKVSPVTIRKEMATLRAAWNWGGPMGLTSGTFPSKGLRYPKGEEKPPFMTMEEVRRQIAAGGEPDVLWDALYLTTAEIAELLAHVKEHATHPWLYPCSPSPHTPAHVAARCCGRWWRTWTSPATRCWCGRRSGAAASAPPAACR